MLLFVALVATANLCVGYVLGVRIGQLPPLPGRKPIDPPAPAFDLGGDDYAYDDLCDNAQGGGGRGVAPTPEQIMQSMAAFQAQLAQVGSEMHGSLADDRAFGDCADRLQQANHDYLEQAQYAIEELDAAGDPPAGCRDAIADSVKQVGEASDEIDTALANGLPDAAGREKLVQMTGELERVVERAETRIAEPATAEPSDLPPAAAADADPAPAAAPTDAGEADAPLASVLDGIDAALASNAGLVVIGALRRDACELPDAAGGAAAEAPLMRAITRLAEQALEESQQLAPQQDGSLLMLLSGDSVEQAATRMERIRQQVEQASFTTGAAKLQCTVSCAIAEAAGGADRGVLVQQLAEALREGDSHGPNRCYYHDGRFPGPLMVEELEVAAVSVPIDAA